MSISRFSLLGFLLLVLRSGVTEVSAWVPALRNNLLPAVVTPHRHLPATLYSTIEDSTETLTDISSATTSQREQITIVMPKIQYTVPGMKRGWKENGVWMDEDGPRNGPPQNFWRQMGDERVYNDNIDLIKDLLKLKSLGKSDLVGANSDGNVVTTDIVNGIEKRLDRLERTNSIRIPSLNRLILNDWAPIVRGGKVVAEMTLEEEESVDVPYRFHIQRTAGQKLAEPTPYGTFDEHLEPGEEVTIEELSASNSVTSTGTLEASSDKHENKLVQGYSNANDGELYLGGITYVTKYIMVMRQKKEKEETDDNGDVIKGPVTEIWMKTDPR